jgi:hypothetical protein
MQENKNLVQEALLQMKNVEEAIAQNAKGILASTMKEEINQLVKESLTEQDDEEVDAEVDIDMDDAESEDMDDAESEDMDTDNEEDMDMDIEMDMDMESDETPIDLTDASDEEILRVFKAMGEEDGIIVKKDGEDIHLKDNDADTEYLVKLGESEEDQNLEEMDKMDIEEEMGDMDTQKVIDAIFSNDGGDFEVDQDEEEVMYEIEFDDESEDELGEESFDAELDIESSLEEDDDMLDEEDEEDLEEGDDMLDEEDDDMLDEEDEEDLEEGDDMLDEDDDTLEEAYDHKKAHKGMKKSETKEGKNISVKPKGVGIGSGPKFKYKDKAAGGFKEDKKEGPKTMGTGKAKFEYKKGENMEGKSKVVKKAETKEAARTYGMGSKKGRGLRKGITPNRNFVYGKNGVKTESLESEVTMLREKNEEYRKALNVFREKLNEVAIFNSNLAYATRLFTEHSTTKKEKINILRRFDDVESLRESKSLYKSIKDELGKTETKSINESVEKKINNTVSSGSAVNLIESKTYENPQFLRMKDLMSKLG